jgi:hypothetical protein
VLAYAAAVWYKVRKGEIAMATTPKAIDLSAMNESAKKKLRSPAYPYLNLETAIKRARTFYEREGRNAAPVAVASTHWGYDAKSSGGTQTAAALISFGLMQDEGSGNQRKLKLTANALKILLDTRANSTERDALIRHAALAPKVHQKIWDRWGVGISNENLRHALVVEWEPPFNENAVEGFIKEYRDTIAFAKLTESDKVSPEVENSGDRGEEKYVPKTGDFVQWESAGTLRFPEPKAVTGFSADGAFAFVDGSSTGLPVSELRKQDAPATPLHVSFRLPDSPSKTHMQEDVFSLSEGRVVIQWPSPLSAESIQDLKDWLKIVERKIARSTATAEPDEKRP